MPNMIPNVVYVQSQWDPVFLVKHTTLSDTATEGRPKREGAEDVQTRRSSFTTLAVVQQT